MKLGLGPALAVAMTLGLSHAVLAAPPEKPLVIKEQGDFFVGGETVFSPATRSDGEDPGAGEVVVNQTWVQYQIPASKKREFPVIMLHGSWHTGKTYLSTPDGREGWGTYFVRQGFPTYIADDVNRGRSGYDLTQYNLVRLGMADPSTLPPLWQTANEYAWTSFRIGPTPGTTYPNSQFPAEAADQYFAQLTDMFRGADQDEKRVDGAIAVLEKVGPSIVMTHSSTGPMGWAAAQARPDLVKAIVTVEPLMRDAFTDFDALADIPILIVRGDFDTPEAIATAQAFVDEVNDAGGSATLISLPDIGIGGNSHMMMMERNNTEIADVIIEWIESNVPRKKVAHSRH